MENVKVAKGGMSIQEKKFRWEILNFDTIVKSEEFLSQQKLEFEIFDSNGVRSAWRAKLSCSQLSKMSKKGKGRRAVNLHIDLIEKDGCCSEILAQVSANLEDTIGIILFRGLTSNKLGFKRTTEEKRYWKIWEISPNDEIELLPVPCGTIIIEITVKLITLLSDPSFGVDVETIRANRKQQLYRKIGMLVDDQKHSDVKIVSSDGQEFFAYRWILSEVSEVFEAMFRTDMKENETGILKIEDLSGNTLKVLLHFFYTGNVGDEWSQPGIVEELIYAAEKYQLPDLKDFLDGSLGRICTVENAANLLELARKMSMKKAGTDILSFMFGGKTVDVDFEGVFSNFDIVKN